MRAGAKPPEREQGFSLLEVLVATAIMSLVAVTVLKVMSASLHAHQACQHLTQALGVAEQVLQKSCREEGLTTGQYQGRTGSFTYLVRIQQQYEISHLPREAQVKCYLISVVVSWLQFGRTKSLELETMRTVVRKES